METSGTCSRFIHCSWLLSLHLQLQDDTQHLYNSVNFAWLTVPHLRSIWHTCMDAYTHTHIHTHTHTHTHTLTHTRTRTHTHTHTHIHTHTCMHCIHLSVIMQLVQFSIFHLCIHGIGYSFIESCWLFITSVIINKGNSSYQIVTTTFSLC